MVEPVQNDDAETALGLRILTHGLSEEEVAAVTSVVSGLVAEQRAQQPETGESQEARNRRRWVHSVGQFAGRLDIR